jgi:cytoskeletal protein CcmA (bactofilin family)
VQDSWLRRKQEPFKAPSPVAAPAPNIAPVPVPPAPAPAHPHAAAADGKRKESRLIVGPDIKLKGVEIIDCDTLVVEGLVEASLDSRVIQIAEHGVFNGTVAIDIAEIHGRFDGDLTARKHLIVHASAKVSGKIRYGRLTVEEGAEMSGELATMAPANKSAEVPGFKRAS